MTFDVRLRVNERVATIELSGELDASSAGRFHDTIDEAAAAGSIELVIRAEKLAYMSSAGLRSLVFARQKMGDDVKIAVVGATEPVAHTIRLAGFDHSIDLIDA
ncbi:anti-sigma factor antagonist [Streptomyces sp. WAC05374]|uniref:STAS domain-containing protein n=1 Tax=unclassified Streptomyces TaxID=2593676 RepID=UPI000F86E4F7|nr:STAS domain-containing protein [Streptomyces sp. WAC05374]RST16803.1 anti-sigma factor antagonist [Streptomyces sp. WAC05374]TDF35942.1 anti-sigma factor antagonist [Streptomyces sp. WAC05374]TDF46572.1 anti-sigma factor antagonist [Streptomyces sp. WAC05374]TDF53591.1 anti-sigma factor antagonist [Streptomyces sp. WAC05374]